MIEARKVTRSLGGAFSPEEAGRESLPTERRESLQPGLVRPLRGEFQDAGLLRLVREWVEPFSVYVCELQGANSVCPACLDSLNSQCVSGRDQAWVHFEPDVRPGLGFEIGDSELWPTLSVRSLGMLLAEGRSDQSLIGAHQSG